LIAADVLGEGQNLQDAAIALRVRYGYSRLHILLKREGWQVNHTGCTAREDWAFGAKTYPESAISRPPRGPVIFSHTIKIVELKGDRYGE
jgi:hypothetical protein